MAYSLLLDGAIRDWVVLPMVLMLVLVGMGRHYVQQLIKSDPQFNEASTKELGQKQTLMQAARLRAFAHVLNEDAVTMRRHYFLPPDKKEGGLLRPKELPAAPNPMSNPTALMDMMKGNVTSMLPNIGMMTFVGWFFSGFVCLKLPFPMPSHSSSMLQRGVDLNSLHITYVSSLSWYFLVMFGLNGIYSLILGEGADMDEARIMQMQMGMGMMGGGQQMGFDAAAAFRMERENMVIMRHEWSANKAERRILGDRYPTGQMKGAIDLTRLGVKDK